LPQEQTVPLREVCERDIQANPTSSCQLKSQQLSANVVFMYVCMYVHKPSLQYPPPMSDSTS
jgi:hypothetical protein